MTPGPTVRWADVGRSAIVPAWLVVSPVSANAIRLYALLTLHVGDSPPTRAVLAATMGISVGAVDKAVTELTTHGAITRDARSIELHLDATTAPVDDPEPAPLPVVRTAAFDQPPPIPRIAGRNLPLDALTKVCSIDEGSPRIPQAVAALNGRRGGKGITHLFWEECRRVAHSHPNALGALAALHGDPDRYARILAQEIENKTGLIHRAQPWRESITPAAIRDLWLDIHLIPEPRRPDRGLTAEEVRQLR